MPYAAPLISLTAIVFTSPVLAQPSRQLARGSWSETARLEDNEGVTLQNPQRIVNCGTHLVVLDLQDPHITAFSVNTKASWRFGRAGGAAGEFRSLGSVSCDAAGNTWVPDRGNSKLVVIDKDGKLVRESPLLQSVRRLAVAPSGKSWFGLTSSAAGEVATRYDADGSRPSPIAAPARLKGLNTTQREGYIAATADGGAVAGFRWSSLLLRISPKGDVSVLHEGIEPIPFAEFRAYKVEGGGATMMRIAPDAVEATQWLFVDGDTLCVIFVGGSADRGRIVDRYRVSDGRYLGSTLLPQSVVSAVTRGGTLYTLTAEPIPAVVRYIWTAAR